jgi:glycerophosphoryl diester phosphodiesterase
MGADGIEIDVHCLEGELIVIHDSTLNRTTNSTGPLRRRTLDYVRRLDAGKGERIPLLREVLDAVDGRGLVNIELKGAGTAQPALAVVREYIARGWAPESFLLSSFRRRELRELRGCGLRLGVLFAGSARGFRRVAGALGAWSIHVPLAHATPRLVSSAHADGRPVFVFTVNERKEMDRMAGMDVDGIFTDYPDRWTGKPG